MAKFCINCGRVLKENEVFCVACGRRRDGGIQPRTQDGGVSPYRGMSLSNADIGNAAALRQQANHTPAQPHSKEPNKKILIIAGVVLFALAAVGGAVYQRHLDTAAVQKP